MTIKTHPSALRKFKERVKKSFEALRPPNDDEPTPPKVTGFGSGPVVRVTGKPQC